MSKMCLQKKHTKKPAENPAGFKGMCLKKCSVLQKTLQLWKQKGSYHVQNHGRWPKNHLKYLENHRNTPELVDWMLHKLICRCKVNIACWAEAGSSIQGRIMPLKTHQNQHLWPDVAASARWADIAPYPLVFSSHLFPAFATISYCSCPCVSEALPAPWTWTGSSPRPGTAGGPEPDGALQNGCAGKDCTASLPRWWKDSENRPRVRIAAGQQNARACIFHRTSLEFWVTNDSCQAQQHVCIPALIKLYLISLISHGSEKKPFFPSTKQI